jgi:hypothetical protein
MSRWQDLIDSAGCPFEVATPEQIFNVSRTAAFELEGSAHVAGARTQRVCLPARRGISGERSASEWCRSAGQALES